MMKLRKDYRLLLLGRKPGQMLEFSDFKEVIKALDLLRKRKQSGQGGILSKFRSMGNAYADLEHLKTKKVNNKLEKSKPWINSKSDGSKREYNLKIENSYAQLLNEKGKIKVGGEVYNLLDDEDLKEFSDKLSGAYSEYVQRKGIVENIICHQYHDGDRFCVSINKDTMLPSSADAHVEHWENSSYITRYFDVTANGELTRIQMWKGHLLALNFTGGEISVWKPDEKLVIEWNSLFDIKFVKKKYFGSVWFPYIKNQLYISWELADKNSGETVFSYGSGSDYEAEKKWWAGKWLTHGNTLDVSKKGEDLLMRYKVRDADSVILEGEW